MVKRTPPSSAHVLTRFLGSEHWCDRLQSGYLILFRPDHCYLTVANYPNMNMDLHRIRPLRDWRHAFHKQQADCQFVWRQRRYIELTLSLVERFQISSGESKILCRFKHAPHCIITANDRGGVFSPWNHTHQLMSYTEARPCRGNVSQRRYYVSYILKTLIHIHLSFMTNCRWRQQLLCTICWLQQLLIH